MWGRVHFVHQPPNIKLLDKSELGQFSKFLVIDKNIFLHLFYNLCVIIQITKGHKAY